MTAEKPKTRTITLTDHPPVRIREDAWPVIAHGSYYDFDGQYECQSNRWWRADLRVRQHADGRAVVYGVYRHSTDWQHERDLVVRAGVLLGRHANLVDAIRTVGSELARATREAGHDFGAHIAAAVRDCIADLPAQELE